jgi:predicted RNase H-like HicB family nuclease
MKKIDYYLKQRYTIELKSYSESEYCAEIKEIPGLCAYGKNEIEALEELEIIKKSAFELMLEQKKEIPIPTIKLEIPISIYEKFSFKKDISKYAVI